jgi:hypothetical protein
MHFPSIFTLGALASLTTSAPIEVQGSKHVAYLSTCYPDECPIGFCDPTDFRLLAIGYFANGPPKTATATPSSLGTLSVFSGADAWEGARKTVRVASVGTIATNIAKNAKGLPQSEVAGDAAVTGTGGEAFVCFRDGKTPFRITYELDRYTCTGEYYCPSTDIGV